MSINRTAVLIAAAVIVTSAPAWAGDLSGCTSVPEPADFALFAAGVLGVLVGRHSSRRRAARNAERN